MAHERSLEALQIAKKTDDVFPKTFVYSNYGLACYTKGLVKEGMDNLIKGIQFCDKIDTIDMELRLAKTMTTKAFDNDKIDGRALKAFRATKKKLKFGQNARNRILSFPEYLKLQDAAPAHLKGTIVAAMSTGMRMGEILELRWSFISNGFIRLPINQRRKRKPRLSQ